jgi:hypothetical protein
MNILAFRRWLPSLVLLLPGAILIEMALFCVLTCKLTTDARDLRLFRSVEYADFAFTEVNPTPVGILFAVGLALALLGLVFIRKELSR